METLTQLPAILLVEDNPKDVDLLTARFRRARLKNPLHVVPDGMAAARYLAGEGQYGDRESFPLPGIVILDLNLPKMDGFEVLAWIRAREQFNTLPVIILSGDNTDPMIQRARAYGADGYLVKGMDIDGLFELLKHAFLGWALLPSRVTSRFVGAENTSDPVAH